MGIAWDRIVVENALQEILGEPKISKNGKEWQYNSHYTSDNKRKLYVNVEKHGVFNDFKSGEKGSFERLIADYNGWSEDEAIRHLIANFASKMNGVTMIGTTIKKKDPVVKNGNLPEHSYKIKHNDKYSLPYIKYLQSRGMPDSFIYNCYYSIAKVMNGKPFEMKNYVIIPYLDEFDKVIYWTGRCIYENKRPKYYNCPEADASHFVYNVFTDVLEVVITEGVLDAIKFGKNGIATGGKSVSDFQIDAIVARNFKRIILVPDNEEYEKGPKATIELFKKLRERGQNVFIFNWISYGKKIRLKVKDFASFTEIEHFKVKDLEKHLIDNDFEAQTIYMVRD
jgi:hypothetical protein